MDSAQKPLEPEDDVALVDFANAAAASLLSPNLWVRRPVARTAKPADVTVTPTMIPKSASKDMTTTQRRLRSQKRSASAAIATDTASPKEEHVKEEDVQDTEELRQKELATMKILREDIRRSVDNNKGDVQQLKSATAELQSIICENDRIKRMFVALGVQAEDVDLPENLPEAEKKQRMVEVGRRLVHNLNNGAPVMAQTQQPQHPLAAQGGDSDTHPQAQARPGTLPLGLHTPPAQYPKQAQIAAGALVHAKGEPALAVWHLLDEAIKARRTSGGGGGVNGGVAAATAGAAAAVATTT